MPLPAPVMITASLLYSHSRSSLLLMRSAACQCAPILAADPQGCTQQHEVFVDELSGHYGEPRKASSRCLPNARGHEQKAQRGQKHADSQRTADQGGADGKRPGSNESDHDFHDTHQGGEGSDAKNRIGPAHQRTIGGKAGDSLSLVRCDFVPPIHKRTRTRLYRMVYLPTASTVCAQVEDIASRPSSCCLREMLG
jgi:hypothetical protein